MGKTTSSKQGTAHVGNDRSAFVAMMLLLAGSAFIVILVTVVVEVLTQRDTHTSQMAKAVKVRANASLTNVLDLKIERRGGGADHIGRLLNKTRVDVQLLQQNVLAEAAAETPKVEAPEEAPEKSEAHAPKVPGEAPEKSQAPGEEPVEQAPPPGDEAEEPTRAAEATTTTSAPPEQEVPVEAPAETQPEAPPAEAEAPAAAAAAAFGLDTSPATTAPTQEAPAEEAATPPEGQQTPAPERKLQTDEAGDWCVGTKFAHGVVPGRSWGSLSEPQRRQWLDYHCDRFFCHRDPQAGRGTYNCRPN